MTAMKRLGALLCQTACSLAFVALVAPAVQAAPASDVGDGDSFGGRAIWIGVVQTGTVTLAASCPGDGPTGPDDRCVTLNPTGTPTGFSFEDLGRIKLPTNSVGTLLCHWATPLIFYVMQNNGIAPVAATAQFRSIYRVDSAVLQDPTLINPTTGLPFAGSLQLAVTAAAEARTIGPGETDRQSVLGTRTCIGGLMTLRSLMQDYGLTEAVAKRLLREPMTVRVGVAGSVNHVVSGSLGFGVRFMTNQP